MARICQQSAVNQIEPEGNVLTQNWQAVNYARTQVNPEEPDEPGRTTTKLAVFYLSALDLVQFSKVK